MLFNASKKTTLYIVNIFSLLVLFQLVSCGGSSIPEMSNRLLVSSNEIAGNVVGYLNIHKTNDENEVSSVVLMGEGSHLFDISTNGAVSVTENVSDFFDNKFRLHVHVVNSSGTSHSMMVSILVAKVYEDARPSLQEIVDNLPAGGVLQLERDTIYVLNNELNFRDYGYLTIDGNGSVIKRANGNQTSTTLNRDYDGSKTIYVNKVPENYLVGDMISIASGISISNTAWRRKIIAINHDSITLDSTFSGDFNTGDIVFKSFTLISADYSTFIGASNPGIVLKNIIFDGNARENQINYAWYFNNAITLLGGKTTEIFNNVFFDMPNETIVGHGMLIYDNLNLS